jgi:hypothetical protein
MTKENLNANSQENGNQNAVSETNAPDISLSNENVNTSNNQGSVTQEDSKQDKGVLGGEAEDNKKQIVADWPEDWREKAAKGDEKRLNQLKRYASPLAAFEALESAQKKISSYIREDCTFYILSNFKFYKQKKR